jgi:hypothetical protein
MTRVKQVQTTCYVCGTYYEGLRLLSWYTRLPRPHIPLLACPRCHAPYKNCVRPQIGLVRNLLPKVESDPEHVASKLVRYSLVLSDVDAWQPVFLHLDEILAAVTSLNKDSSSESLELEVNLIRHLQLVADEDKYQPMIEGIIHRAKTIMEEEWKHLGYTKYKAD